ncbi:MAG TPA: hypothetical protein VFA26_02675 [Gemmataceae bacterium]|nr:hypothetical protein [Gemmataceae bacterium]
MGMRCAGCGAENDGAAKTCATCGARLRRPRREAAAPGGGFTWSESPNPAARAAYRCSLLAMVPFLGLVLGPVAVAWGLWARHREKVNPSERGTAQAMAAVVFGALTAVTNWVGLLLMLRGLNGG